MNNEYDEHETISMFDVKTGGETEMIVADAAVFGGARYLLVYDSKSVDDDVSEASVLKEIKESGDDVYYERVDDGDELESVAALFTNGDYKLEK